MIAISNFIIKVEKKFVALLALVITLLALLNVVTRAFNKALFWVDELLIYAMVWMVLIGSSVMVRENRNFHHLFYRIARSSPSNAVCLHSRYRRLRFRSRLDAAVLELV